MPLVTLRRIINYRSSCACCGLDWPYVIECHDNSTHSITDLCFRCFHILEAVTIRRDTALPN